MYKNWQKKTTWKAEKREEKRQEKQQKSSFISIFSLLLLFGFNGFTKMWNEVRTV